MRIIMNHKVVDVVIVGNHLINSKIPEGMIEVACMDRYGSIDRKYTVHSIISESDVSKERKVTYKDASYTQVVKHNIGKDTKTWRADIGCLTVAIECKTKKECEQRVRQWIRLNPITVFDKGE